MKFKVFKEAEKEDEVFFRLDTTGSGIFLECVDNNGNHISNILKIQNDGTLYRSISVSEKTGLSLDADRRVNLSEEE